MTTDTPDLPSTGYVRLAQIIAPRGPLPVSQSTIWRWVKEGRFPKPKKLSSRVTAWPVDDIRKWMSGPPTSI